MPVDLLDHLESNSGQPVDLLDHLAENKPNGKKSELLSHLGNYGKESANTFLQSVLGAGDAVNNLPRSLANMVLPKSLQAPMAQTGNPQNIGYQSGKFLGDIAGFMGGGEALDSARIASESIPYLGKLAQGFSGDTGASNLLKQISGSALYGAAENPENRTKGALESGAFAGAITGVPTALSSLEDKILSSLMSSSGKDVAANARAAEGTNTPLGDVVGSPSLKRIYENVLSKIPFSGVEKQQTEAAQKITDKGNNILNKYLQGTHPDELNEKIGDALTKAAEEQRKQKNLLYKGVEDAADQIGLKLKLPSFTEAAKKYSNIIQDQSFLKFEPDSKALLNRLANYESTGKEVESSILDQSGKPFIEKQYPTLKESNILAGLLGHKAKEYGASPLPENRNMASIFKDLNRSLKSDIKQEIAASGDPELKDKFLAAENNYKENFSGFLDKDIYKFTNGDKSVDDLISSFIKTGSTTDKAEQIDKLMEKLPKNDQDLVKAAYLSRALKGSEDNRSIDPRALRNLWNDNKLGQNQKKSLFNNKAEREQLDDYSNLVRMNSDALDRMFNPKTGQRNLELMAAALAGHFGGIATLGTLPAIANISAKKLTSPELRSRIVSGKKSPPPGAKTNLLNALTQVLMQQGQSQ